MIDLDEYDLSYEIQFITFMITLLEPYIRFECKGGVPQIYRKGGGMRLLIEEGISVKEYVYFIQYTFPNIIDTEIKLLNEQESDARMKKNILAYICCPGRYTERELLNLTLPEIKAYDMFKEMSQEEINEQKRYYDIDQKVGSGRVVIADTFKTFLGDKQYREKKLKYLKSIKIINKGNGKVKDVMQFLENLQYIYEDK